MRSAVAVVVLCAFTVGCGQDRPGGTRDSGPRLTSTTLVRYCLDVGLPGCGTRFRETGVVRIPAGERVGVRCRTRRWLWVRSVRGVDGYVPARVVDGSGTSAAPACRDDLAVVAATSAAERVGEKTARARDRAAFRRAAWSPGPFGEWSGDCVKLGYAAWAAAGIPTARGDAIANYQRYLANGLVRTGSTPAVGALVWFRGDSPAGHVAVHLGNGLIVSTTGADGDGTPVRVLGLRSYDDYLGWWNPAAAQSQ